ncbi:MAG TPA: LD-carboxypeptidase [Armatimonadota bacterium]|nr:LD-carboxypeptidase [Armatimonadota bacterium]HQK95103.1 LD-carboxypeptidase [Armatimonadota bacterium]
MRIGIVAPSCPPTPQRLDAGVRALRHQGFEVVVSHEVLRPRPFTAADDQMRTEAIADMLRREDIDALVCARGGFGAARLIPYLSEVGPLPHKPFMGFSDITVLLLSWLRSGGPQPVWGPMVAVSLGDDAPPRAVELGRRALRGDLGGAELIGPDDHAQSMVSGTVEAEVVGGTLCLCSESIGTPYELDCKERILLLEDQNEDLYRIDRYLMHLRLAGKLDDACGFILGRTFVGDDVTGFARSLDELLADYLAPLGKPVLANVPTGHAEYCLPIPFGVPVRMAVGGSPSEHRLTVLGGRSLALSSPA